MRIAILVTLFATAVALADDFKTTSGKEYKNATVTQVEADGIVIKTKGGISKVYLPSCPKMFRSGFTMIPPTRLPPKPPPFGKHRSLTSSIASKKNSPSSKKLPAQNSTNRG